MFSEYQKYSEAFFLPQTEWDQWDEKGKDQSLLRDIQDWPNIGLTFHQENLK